MMFAGARSGLNARLSVSTGGQESGLTGLCGECGQAVTSFQRQMAERRPREGETPSFRLQVHSTRLGGCELVLKFGMWERSAKTCIGRS